MPEWTDDLADSFLELNRLIVNEETLPTTLQRIAAVSCRAVRGCDNCGLTLEQDGQPATVAHTGDDAVALDEAQYAADRGPCLEAYRHGQPIHLALIGKRADLWPEFAARAAQLGVESSLSMPLRHEGVAIGALNLYSRQAHAFDDDAKALAEAFSAQAAVAISNALIYWRTFELTQNLKTALQNRDVIGQAKGVLMARSQIASDEAFDLLRLASQQLNRKLIDVANYVVRSGEVPTESRFD